MGGANDIDRETQASSLTQITGGDEDHKMDVIDVAGVKRAAVDANISSINIPLGKDPLPDMFIEILIAPSAIGESIRFEIAGTNVDVTTPDRDLPDVDLTYVAIASDVGDEQQFGRHIVDYLNSQTSFVDDALLEANFVNDLRAVVHISSTAFSLNGEFAERPNAGDVTITGTGAISFLQDGTNNKLVSRAKEVSLARDPNNPHRLGVQNVSGTVRLSAQEVDQLLKEYLTDVPTGLSDQMAINGLGTPVAFRVSSNPVGGLDKVLEILKFIVADTNIKVSSGNFLGSNQALANGIDVRFYKNGVLKYVEPLITETIDILGQWSTSASDNKIINQAGGDYLESTFNLSAQNLQFILESGKDDYIEVTIQDNLASRDSIKMLAGGFFE